MAVVIGDTSSTSGTATNTLTFAHVVATGEKLIVGVAAEDNSGGDVAVSTITYNGDSLTKVDHAAGDNGAVWNRSELWELTNPDVGTANVVITLVGSVDGVVGMAVSVGGLKAQTYEAKSTGSSGGSTSESASVTTLTSNAFVIAVGNSGAGGDTFVLSSPAVELFNINNATVHWGGLGYINATAPASTTIAWTLGVSNRWAEVIAAYEVSPELSGGYFFQSY